MSVLQPVTVTITGLTHSGEGIARLPDGRVLFVSGGLPGETVRVTLTVTRARLAQGEMTEVLTASPARVTPPCPYFGDCGGCQLQHLAYPAQLRFKTSQVREQLQRVGRLADPPVADCLPSPSPWAYRNIAQFALDEAGRPGFRRRASHDILPVERCPILDERLNRAIPQPAPIPRPPQATHRTLRVGDAGELSDAWEREGRIIAGGQAVKITVAAHSLPPVVAAIPSFTLRVSPPSFFQVNTAAAGLLVNLVWQGADLPARATVVDAYCGVGLFAVALARAATGCRVTGIEIERAALADAQFNGAGLSNLRWQPGRVEILLARILAALGRVDVVVLDPPRTGVETGTIAALLRHRPRRLVYVSCNPATLARDIARLQPVYRLLSAQPVDLFPQTFHVETVATLALV